MVVETVVEKRAGEAMGESAEQVVVMAAEAVRGAVEMVEATVREGAARVEGEMVEGEMVEREMVERGKWRSG